MSYFRFSPPAGRRFTIASAVLLAFVLAGRLSAVEVSFQDPDDYRSNFKPKGNSEHLEIKDSAEGPALVFTHEKPAVAVALYAPGGKMAFTAAQSAAARFKVGPGTSFGIVVRGTADLSDSYLLLVNAGPTGKGGMLRVFRAPIWPQPDLSNTDIAQKPAPIDTAQWYRLKVTATDEQNAVRITMQLLPDGGGPAGDKPLAELSITDDKDPLTGPGQVAVRFFAGPSGTGKVMLQSLSMTPDPQPVDPEPKP